VVFTVNRQIKPCRRPGSGAAFPRRSSFFGFTIDREMTHVWNGNRCREAASIFHLIVMTSRMGSQRLARRCFPRVKRTSGPEKSGPSAEKDFFNTIAQQAGIYCCERNVRQEPAIR
jgi:hypothetical protein